jgi:hypothetical protein
MTLVTVAANPAFVVQFSDRRLSDSDGGVYTEEATKVVYLQAPTWRFVMGYTGLALVRGVATNRILIDLMFEAMKTSELDAEGCFKEFRRLLSIKWREWAVRSAGPTHSRLTVMLTGYLEPAAGGHSGPLQCLITNYQDWGTGDSATAREDFDIVFRSHGDAAEWPTIVQRIGAWQALGVGEAEELRELLAPGVPPSAVVDSLLSRLPAHSAAFPTIGPRANAVVLKPFHPPEGSYHSPEEVRTIHFFDQIVAKSPDNIRASHGMQITQVTEGEAFITNNGQRQPCSCRSGKQYRRCHGKKDKKTIGIVFDIG